MGDLNLMFPDTSQSHESGSTIEEKVDGFEFSNTTINYSDNRIALSCLKESHLK